jgi:DNA polymerase-3 subunit delta'
MWQAVGQPKAITLLERSIETGQLSHAYLFVGPPHVGKLTLALNLAQAVNCGAAAAPCGECASCRRIAAHKHADVQIIGLISEEKREISIEQIREMQTAASLPPYEGRNKVFIFDKAELLSHEAANCLLKTLEEPLPQVLFILLTARENALLPTIVSRCQRVELRPLPVSVIREALIEDHGVAVDRAELLARLSGGCLGWALLAIQDEKILEERSRRLSTLVALSYASLKQRFAYASELAAQFSKSREEVEETLTLWLGWWHDLLLIKGGDGKSITNLDQQSALFQQARDFSTRQVMDFIHHLQTVNEQFEQNANPRLALEVLMLSMPTCDATSTRV